MCPYKTNFLGISLTRRGWCGFGSSLACSHDWGEGQLLLWALLRLVPGMTILWSFGILTNEAVIVV